MTKNEFLIELRKNLSGLPKEEIEDRITFYEEMINDRMDEGKTEEEAVADIGTTDQAVRTIASQTKMSTLVKEKIKPKRSISTLEIVLIVLGFPLWFPLLIVTGVLILVAYMMLWLMVIVTYSIEASFIGGFVSSLVGFFGALVAGEPSMLLAGCALLALAGGCFFVFACIAATKANYKITKSLFLGIKAKIIKGGK